MLSKSKHPSLFYWNIVDKERNHNINVSLRTNILAYYIDTLKNLYLTVRLIFCKDKHTSLFYWNIDDELI
jgi:hypothetical protein